MGIAVEAIHHVGLVVSDAPAAERFYAGALGLRRHPARRSWFVLGATSTLHLIPRAAVPGAGAADADPPHHAYRHVALQVADLRAVLRHLLAAGVRVTQVGFDGGERVVTAGDDPLDFGVGTLFVRDPDGNLIEFVQPGHGIFATDVRPRASG
jgi:catechol 2,3-dioxygenase-like lactoylglutathione lyase family enzyme